MKTSLLFSLALAALVVAGCNKSTRSNTASNDTSTRPSDYTATTSTTTTGTSTSSLDATANRMGSDMRTAANSASTDARNAASSTSNDLRSAANSASSALGSAASNVATTARMTQWKLNPSDIQADLDHNREIVRTKDVAAGAPTGSSDKSVIESLVKGRLEADSDIAALKLKADADKHGEVKLSGKAHSAEEVGRAIALALDTEGVTKVTSKIKLDKDAKTNP